LFLLLSLPQVINHHNYGFNKIYRTFFDHFQNLSDFFEFSLVPGHEENLHPFSKTHSGLTEASWTEADCEAVSPFLFLRGLETKTPFDTLKKEKKEKM